jgi:signal transduction histidine kinase
MLQAIVQGNAVLETELPSSGPVIMANANQIVQLLKNLITNSCEAVAERRGDIHLSVRTVNAGNIPALRRFPLDWQPQNSSYACLEVSDTGNGIDDEDIEKLFDPFFSTKLTGRGMGLAVVLGIVRVHSGVVVVESEPRRGSTFLVFFPLTDDPADKQTSGS